MKRRKWLCLLFTVAALIPVYLFGIFMYKMNQRNTEELLDVNVKATNEAQVVDIQKFCEARKAEMNVLANLDAVQDLITSKHEDIGTQNKRKYLENLLEQRKMYYDYIESITVIDSDFWIVASSDEYDSSAKSALGTVRDEKCLTGEFYISGLKTRRRGDEDIQILVAYQGIWKGEKLLGYLVEEISPDYFEQNRKEMNLWEESTLYLLDKNDKMIAAGGSEGRRSDFLTDDEERESFTREWARIDMEKEPSGKLQYSINDREYITYYSAIDYTEWKILLTGEVDPYKTKINQYQLALAISLALVSVMLLFMNLLMLHFADQEVKENAIVPLLDSPKKTLEEQVRDLIGDASRRGKRVAVGYVDIDCFRQINGTYGIQNGDKAVSFVSMVLKNNISGVSGRKEGDEFIFATQHVEHIEKKLQKIIKKLNEGFPNSEIDDVMKVPCSIGVVIAEEDALSYRYLIRRADEAMYHVKKQGKNHYELVDLTKKK